MFIETLEFTIPVDLCSLCTTLQKGSLSDLEFPASVNSYGTTQDASIQVALRSKKLTFKIDGVSSNASIISKSECKTLKLSVFDVDRSLIPQENYNFNSSNVNYLQQSSPVTNTLKRSHEQFSSTSTPVQPKVRRTSHDSNRKKARSPNSLHSSDFQTNHRSKEQTSNNVIVKTEPDDPDLIEIEPDPEPIKTEDPQTQTDNPSNLYQHTSTSSSYERNVPHVPDYSEPTTSHHNQQDNHSADDFLVFQDDTYDGEDNEADYSNDDLMLVQSQRFPAQHYPPDLGGDFNVSVSDNFENFLDSLPQIGDSSVKRLWQCEHCGKTFTNSNNKKFHIEAVHHNKTYKCVCGKQYKYPCNLIRHKSDCAIAKQMGSVSKNIQ